MVGASDTQAQRRHEQQEGQQQRRQGQEVTDGGVRPPALDRVSIASAIGDQMPKLSRCVMHAVSLPRRRVHKASRRSLQPLASALALLLCAP